MSRSEKVIYPPGEILNPIMGKTDYEYIILWMLNNNTICEWADFTAEISESTLSGHLRKLMNKDFIEKPERNKYTITNQGKERFNELTYDKKAGKRRLKYPPKMILKRRNYDHWILWMLYNNYSCKWSDFKKEPLGINQSSLSNNLNSLIENGFVVRENKEYIISPLGKTEYFSILKLYDLDRQSILEQESKRIEEITEKTAEFFLRHNIEDDELKFRYLDYILKLNYSKVQSTLRNEEDFNKILLFLSINHTDQYPDYLSPEEFSLKYNIDGTTLKYYIREIVDNEFFKVKFFKIKDEKGGIYYFQKNEPVEKILNAIVEKYITKFTYLNKFQENPNVDIDLLLESILNDICGNLFNEQLKPAIRTFLPEYIKYLAYKIEIETKLVDREAKLEGFVWQNIFEEFQTFEPSATPIGVSEEEYFYNLDKNIFQVLDVFYLSKLDFLKANEIQETLSLKKYEIFEDIYKLLNKNKIKKARELYDKGDYEIPELHQLILKDILETAQNNFEESINITTSIIKKFQKSYIGYLFQSLSYLLMEEAEKSLKVIEKGIKEAPNILLSCQRAQILIKIYRKEEALSYINDTLLNHPYNVTLLRLKYLHYLVNWEFKGQIPKDPLSIINSAIKLNPQDKELLILKSMYYFINNKYREGKRFLIREIDFNIFKKNPKIDTVAFFLLAFSYTARGKFEKALKIANQLYDIYPNHPLSYLIKALVLGYNLIYQFKFQEPNIDTFLGLIETAISLEPLKYKKVKFLLLQANVLHGIKQYDESIATIDSALEIIPNQFMLHFTKAYYLLISKREFEALELTDNIIKQFPKAKNTLYKQKSFILYKLKKYEEGLQVIEELIKSDPEDIVLVNNKVVFLAYSGRREEAIETADYLISLDPNNGNSYDSYGDIFMVFREYENAIKKFERALKVDPTGFFGNQTCLKLGLCYQELKKYEKALEYFEKGKILTDRMLPGQRELYLHEAEKYISELRELMKKDEKK
jgi:tetratricopeptide (TPR) repeat protein/DNA-binding HxlR family transcriptional regulator